MPCHRHGNPLTRPPLAVCQQGVVAIRKFFVAKAEAGKALLHGALSADVSQANFESPLNCNRPEQIVEQSPS